MEKMFKYSSKTNSNSKSNLTYITKMDALQVKK